MDDLISRQAAIDALGEEPEVWTGADDEVAARGQWRIDKAAIEAVPTAEPMTGLYVDGFNDGYKAGKEAVEPKRGKWITRGHMCECTACEHSRPTSVYPMFFCPYCGARMEE